MNGIINILKPPRMTSHDVVNYIRKSFKLKKVGHTGTLDPMAAGVLPICIGSATKISNYLLNESKRYRCEMVLGQNTDTQDRWGNVIQTRKVNVSELDITRVMDSFKGEIWQVPPMYSAVKYKGKKLYELARRGIEAKRESRKVFIYDLTILRIDGNTILFDVSCSKGTYIRTLCEDIGDKLDCGAYMSFLLRTESGKFKLEDSITLEMIEQASLHNGQLNFLYPIDYPLMDLPKIIIKKESERYLINGNNIYLKNIAVYDALNLGSMVRLYVQDRFVALGTVKKDEKLYIDIHRVF